MSAEDEEHYIEIAFQCGEISREQRDKLVSDITPTLYAELYRRFMGG